jgi:hypothetical protein
VAVVRFELEREEHHLGILADYRGGLSLIHALRSGGVREHRLDSKWRARIVAAYRFPGVE